MKFKIKWHILQHDFKRVAPLWMAILYALSGGGWILFSDRILGTILIDHDLFVLLSTARGLLYVAVTAVFFYLLFNWGLNSLQRYRLLVDNSQEIILFIRPDGQILDANQAAVKRYGYTHAELIHMSIQKLHLPEKQLKAPSLLNSASEESNLECWHLCKDGSSFPVAVSTKRGISNGKPIILSIIRDITERRNEEAVVWLEKERAQVTLESIGDAVITTDVRGNVEHLNPIAETLTGWTKSEAIGRPLELVFRIINEETGETVENPIVQCLREGHTGRLANHIALIHRKGHTIAIEDSAAPIRDRNNAVIGGVLVFHDVTAKRNHLKEMAFQAHHDALTGLPNRLLFKEILGQALAQARRKQGKLAVLFLDLDRFKLINDTRGHDYGDQLLKVVAERVRQTLREGDMIARQGGDEFLVLLPEISHEKEAATVAERILEEFSQPLILNGKEVYTTTSIGISLYPTDGSDLETLVKQADAAMYCAKDHGRNNYQFFTEELNIKANDRLSIENSLHRAVERGEFVLHYQPQVDFESGSIVGLEALIRWNSPERGMVAPVEFISVAEENGLIVPIGEWVLRTACAQAMCWQEQGYPPLRMAVNISVRQFREAHFIESIAKILQETGLPPHWLELEITESIAMDDGDASLAKLSSFKELGVQIAIDDFGTGFSSLNYLRRMPIDTLKIDQSFVRDISTGEKGEEVVSAIIHLAKSLRLKVIAEGVETEIQSAFLKEKQCDTMQGYFFSKAVTPQEVEQLLAPPLS